jgi:hypothetical protein
VAALRRQTTLLIAAGETTWLATVWFFDPRTKTMVENQFHALIINDCI